MFTSHMTPRNATILSMLCVPPLLLFAAIHLPSLVFDSPEQNTYFYFARGLSQDLSNSVALWMAAICLVFALVLPAPHDAASSHTNP